MAIFPTGIATDADLYIGVNNLSTVLTDNPLTAGATTVNVSDASGFPTVGIITIELEAIHYTGTTGTSFTGCTRGFDGTTGVSHALNLTVFHDIPAAHHNVLKDEIIAIETQLKNNPIVPNTVVNAGLEIWQRGTSFNNPVGGSFTADKWQIFRDGGSTFVVSKETTLVDTGTSAMKFDLQIVGGATFIYLQNCIENFKEYAGKTVTISARVRSDAGVKLRVADGVASTTTGHTGGGTYETLTVTQTMSSSISEFDIRLGWVVGTTPAISTTYIDSVSLSIGSTAVPFPPEDSSLAIGRAQRYYEQNLNILNQDNAGSTSIIVRPMQFSAEKATVPTITVNGGTLVNVTSVAAGSITIAGFGFQITPTATGDYRVGTANDSSWTAEA